MDGMTLMELYEQGMISSDQFVEAAERTTGRKRCESRGTHDSEGAHEYFSREGSNISYSPYGNFSSGGGNLESLHDKYEREGD